MKFSTICYLVGLSGLATALPADDKSKAPVAPSVVPVPKPSGVAPPVISVIPKPPTPSGPAAPPKPSGTGGAPWGPKPSKSWIISIKPPVGTGTPPKPTKSAAEPPKPTKSAAEPPKPTKSAAEPPKPTKSAAEPPKPTKSAEKPKPTPYEE